MHRSQLVGVALGWMADGDLRLAQCLANQSDFAAVQQRLLNGEERYFLALSEARKSIGGEPAKMMRPVGMEFKSAVVGAISDQTSSNLS
jgi:hypothetical protein